MNSSRHPLEKIVTNGTPSAESAGGEVGTKRPKAPTNMVLTHQYNAPPSPGSSPYSIDLSDIKRPALLLNAHLKIVWQNPTAAEKIWHIADDDNSNMIGRNIFDVLFGPVFKRNVANFSRCLGFFITHILEIITEKQLVAYIDKLDDDRKAVLLSLMAQLDPEDPKNITSGRHFHQTLRSGEMRSFEVFSTNFKEGRLLVFDLQKSGDKLGHVEPISPLKRRVEKIRRQPEPVKIPFALLSCRLNKASIIRTQMLSNEYRRLINDLSLRCLYKVEQCGGIFGKHIECGFYAYFLMDHNQHADPLHVIECVLEIKELMIDLGREWKIRKDWSHDIELNIGLHWENEYIGITSSSTGEMITSFGDGLEIAGAISQLAQDGQIWATKPFIHQLSTVSQKQLRFGILRPGSQHQQPFIRNGFACLKDALNTKQTRVTLEETLNLLPITQIFDLSGARV